MERLTLHRAPAGRPVEHTVLEKSDDLIGKGEYDSANCGETW